MKRNFDKPIRDIDGNAVRTGATLEAALAAINAAWPAMSEEARELFNATLTAATSKPLTLKLACLSALLGAYDDERNLGADEAMNRMELARKINAGGIIDIKDTERDLLKRLVRKRYGGVLIPVVAGELLEQDPKPAGEPA